MKISKTIRDIRLSLGLTQAELAKVIGKKRVTVTAYEKGTIMPPADVYEQIKAMAKADKAA